MNEIMKQFQQGLIEVEVEAENLLLARHQLVENDRVRQGNREALTALRKRAQTTKTSVPLPFESVMKDVESRPLVQEVCATCGDHDSKEKTWLMFPGSGTDLFASIPFHAAHTILEKDQARFDYESKKLQSFVIEKSFSISEKGILADKISPGVLRALLTLTDKPKIEEEDYIAEYLECAEGWFLLTPIFNSGDFWNLRKVGLLEKRAPSRRKGTSGDKGKDCLRKCLGLPIDCLLFYLL